MTDETNDVLLDLRVHIMAMAPHQKDRHAGKLLIRAADEIERLLRENEERWSKPWLGNATTRELLDELRARIEVDGKLDYRTVDEGI